MSSLKSVVIPSRPAAPDKRTEKAGGGGAAGVEIVGFPQILYTRTFGDPDSLFVPLLDSAREAHAMSERLSNHGEDKANAVMLSGMHLVTKLHESLARRLSSSLGAHLRVAFEMNLVSVEQLTFREFIARLADLTYFASLHAMPIDARAAIQLDIALAYPIIDVILGGSGSDAIDLRDLTEIEEQILETVVRLIVQDLHSTFAPVLDLDFKFEQRQRSMQGTKHHAPGRENSVP